MSSSITATVKTHSCKAKNLSKAGGRNQNNMGISCQYKRRSAISLSSLNPGNKILKGSLRNERDSKSTGSPD